MPKIGTKITVVLLCRRCNRPVLLTEALDKGYGARRSNYRCPDCGGVCDLFTFKKKDKKRGPKSRSGDE